jgi:DNA mismatch endonuclease (patch repair protein)
MMSGIRAGNTKPELLIRKALHARGYRYRLHAAGLPGKPDIVLPKHRTAIFIHGCFWHGHDCSLFRMPGTRQEFWQAKIARNMTRDRKVRRDITEAGWRQATVWECAIRGRHKIGIEETVNRILAWLLESSSESLDIRATKPKVDV